MAEAEIRIEGRKIAPGAGHLYLVYRDENGNESVIRAGPEDGKWSLLYEFQPIEVQINILLNASKDARIIKDKQGSVIRTDSPADRGSLKLDLSGRDPAEVWQQVEQHA